MNSSYKPLLACLGGILLGYDTGMIGSALLSIQPAFQLTSLVAGMVVSIVIAGIMAGISITHLLTNRLARLQFISLACVLHLFGYGLASVATNASLLILCRFIAGTGIGILLVIIPTYLTEMAPSHLRGRFIAAFQLAITFGILLGYSLSYFTLIYLSWRWLFAWGLIWSSLLFVCRFHLPTPNDIKTETKEISLPALFKRNYARYWIIGIGLALLSQFTGINAIMYFAPQIFQSLNTEAATTSIAASIVIAGSNFVFTIAALFILDSIGRLPVLYFSLIAQGISLAALAFISHYPFLNSPIAFTAFIVLYIFGYAVGLGPIGWLIITEIYPTPIRSQAVGISIFVNNIAAFIVASSFLSILHFLGKANTFWMYSAICFLGIVFTWYTIPETKKQSLEEIQKNLEK